MRGKLFRYALIIGALILVAVGVIITIGIVQLTKQPGFDTLLPEDSSPLQVLLLAPGNGGSFPADSTILIQASADSKSPIAGIELWINGKLFGTLKPLSAETTHWLAQWNWQPGVEGSYTLLARATDRGGRTGVSAAVILQVSPKAGYVELVTSQAGESLASVAERVGTTPEKLVPVNPQLGNPPGGSPGGGTGVGGEVPPPVEIDINAPLLPDTIIHVPRQFELVTQPDFSLVGPGDAGSGGNPPGGQLPAGTEPPVEPYTPNFIQKLQFQLGMDLKQDSNPPAAPIMWANSLPYDKCQPDLTITYNVHDEDGYFVYRMSQNAPIKVRIATLPKTAPGYGGAGYIDHDKITGIYTYIVSAYNTAGETYSNPVTVDLTKCDYGPGAAFSEGQSTTGGVGIQNGFLTLPASVNLAYLYIGVNDTFWDRVPPGSSNFLSGSGYIFDLNKYLAGLLDKIQDPDLGVTIQVWGWQGGQVGLIGTYTAKVHRAVLIVCSQEGKNQCQGLGGSAAWTREVTMPTDKPLEDVFYDLYLNLSPAMESTKQIYQVSYKPFPGPKYNDGNGTFSSWLIYMKSSSQMNFPMGAYYNDTVTPNYGWEHVYETDVNALKAIYPPGKPFTLYVRVIPFDKQGKVPGVPSNTVILHYQTPPEQAEALPLASRLPSLYTVEILPESYVAPTFINYVNWGCVYVLDAYGGKTAECPPPRHKASSNWDFVGLGSAILKGVANGIDDLGKLLESFKDDIVNAVASVIPGCQDDCKAILKGALNAGFTALTGLPPSLPNFDQLAEGGILYAANELQSSLTGYDCDKKCMELFEGQLEGLVRQARIMQSEPSCTVDEQVAWYFDKEPGWCLGPDVTVEPYPGGSNQPGGMLVKVTRNSAPAPAGDLQSQYFLDIASLGTNNTRKDTYGNSCEYFANGDPITDTSPPLPEGIGQFYKDVEQAELYSPVRIPMPLLNPGESLLVPVTLAPFGFDNTKTVYMPKPGCNGFADFEYLFYKGTSQLSAAEYCFVAENGTTVPCSQGGSDTFEPVNPQDPSDQWP
jgi:hypothetical protein